MQPSPISIGMSCQHGFDIIESTDVVQLQTIRLLETCPSANHVYTFRLGNGVHLILSINPTEGT